MAGYDLFTISESTLFNSANIHIDLPLWICTSKTTYYMHPADMVLNFMLISQCINKHLYSLLLMPVTCRNDLKEFGTQNQSKLLETSKKFTGQEDTFNQPCLLYTSPSPRDATLSRMPSSA